MKRTSSSVIPVCLGAAIAAAVVLVFEWTSIGDLERGPYDARMRFVADPDEARSSRVRLVLRDEDSGESPATLWSELVMRLAHRRPAMILLDDEETFAILGANAGGPLRDAMQRVAKVVLSVPGSTPDVPRSDAPPENATVFVYGETDLASVPPMPTFPESVARAAMRLGLARFEPDDDGVIRRLPLAVRAGDADVPTVPLAGAMAAFGESSVHFADGGSTLEHFAGIDVPLDAGELRLRYRGPAGSFPTTSAAELLRALGDDETESPWLATMREGDLVLFGVRGDAATLVTPTDRALPRVEVVATALDNLIRADGLQRAGLFVRFLIAMALGVAAAALVTLTSGRRRIVGGAGVLASYVAVAWGSFLSGTVLDVTAPIIAALLAATAAHATGRAIRP